MNDQLPPQEQILGNHRSGATGLDQVADRGKHGKNKIEGVTHIAGT